MKRFASLLLIVILYVSASYADDIAVSQSLDKYDIAYEDSALFEITLKWQGNQAAYLFDKPLNPSIDRLKIRGFTSSISSDISSGQEITTKKFRYVLIPTASGLGNIEPVSISYLKWPDSIPGQLFTEAMTINIASPVVVEEDEDGNTLRYIIIGLVVLGVAALVIFKLKKPGKTKEIKKSNKEQFFEDLDLLKKEASSDLKKFKSGLYKILVEFLSNEYEVNISEYDESTFFEQMKESKLSNDQIDKISGWLASSQKAKYSPVVSAPGDAIRLESEVRNLIEKI